MRWDERLEFALLGPLVMVVLEGPGRKGREQRCLLDPSDIHVYTWCMKVVKVRRVGNSNVISIPKELEPQGYVPGASVLVEELPGGD